MADISKITLPSGTTYNIKDATARAAIEAFAGGSAVVFMGVSTTPLTDGGNETPMIGGSTRTPAAGQLVFHGTQEYVYGNDSKWHALGDLSTLGNLAYKNSATASYQPAGTVSKPTFTGSSSTVTVTTTANTNGNYQPEGTVSKPTFSGNSLTSTGTYTPSGSVTVTTNGTTNKTAIVNTVSGTATYTPGGSVSVPTISIKTAGATNNTLKPVTAKSMVSGLAVATPGATAPANAITYYDVANETLSLYQIGATKADSVTLGNAVTVKTSDAEYQASQPTFSGTGVRLSTGNIAVPSTYTATFTGTEGDVSVSGTPSGSVSQPTFTGTKVQISGTTTAAGSVSQPTFTGTTATITVS